MELIKETTGSNINGRLLRQVGLGRVGKTEGEGEWDSEGLGRPERGRRMKPGRHCMRKKQGGGKRKSQGRRVWRLGREGRTRIQAEFTKRKIRTERERNK